MFTQKTKKLIKKNFDSLKSDDEFKKRKNEYNKAIQAIALYNYHAEEDDDLSFKKGDILVVYQKNSNGWWKGNFPFLKNFGELNWFINTKR